MKKLLLAALVTFSAFTSLVYAQDTEQDENGNSDVSTRIRIWEASLPGGNYMVSLTRISSVSMHSYLVNGNYMVHEVVVDTSGAALARFYAIELIGEKSDANIAKNLIERGKQIAERGGNRVGIDPNTLVEKTNPHTTHAKTIEYRLSSKDDLDQLLKSAQRAWRENRGRKFTIN